MTAPHGEQAAVGWRCTSCGWATTAFDTMQSAVWPEKAGVVSLVCPSCHAEGTFVDHDVAPRGEQAPLLLDLYCCQGGASEGYRRAGFDVVGLDLEPQPRYPFPLLRMNALEAMTILLDGKGLRFGDRWLTLEDFTAGHASPPCQAKTKAQKIQGRAHPRLIEPTRFLLDMSGLPYIIENVVPEDADADPDPLIDPVMLCGAMFGLETYRHRLFESNVPLSVPEHPVHLARNTKMGRPPQPGEFMHVVGNFSGVDQARGVMDMPWANRDGLREAIPPAYSEHLGRQLLAHIRQEAAA